MPYLNLIHRYSAIAMRPPLPTGFVLQNRYRVLSVLGQGGFGRTYLAEDQGRFNELCAIKELNPPQSDAYALEKSRELFQREAQILYQIQHPQIPQFRANFEQDQRLFLVQDYVEGQTYRNLLNQRRMQGYVFSEAEMQQLLRQLLPVLAHIHSKGIIHRDIAPDNIMLREKDHLPVLIDFGVVKELVTQFQASVNAPGTVVQAGTVPQNTTVGKLGYAPSEQMQTGRAYPCSDLYSLAVTVVVLLTGREPQELFDDTTLTWYWQRWAAVSPGFAQVLNRMLSYQPTSRYQSVAEVVQALDAAQGIPQPPAYQPPPPIPPTVPVASAPPPVAATQAADPSRMQTVAVGRRPDAVAPVTPTGTSGPSIRPRSSVWDDPWAVAAIGLGLVVLTGLGSWAIVSALLNRPTPAPTDPVATLTPTPVPTATATPTTKPSPSPSVSPIRERVDIDPGERAVRTGTLEGNQTAAYRIRARQGQVLSAALTTEGVLMTVRAPDRTILANRVQSWNDTLGVSGDYSVELSLVKGLPQSDYQLDIGLEQPATPTPSPSVSPSPSPSPTEPVVDTEPVRFPPGENGVVLNDRVGPNRIKRYRLRASRGQVMGTRVVSGAVGLRVRSPSGVVLTESDTTSWESELPESGVYELDVVSSQDTDFSVGVSIRQ